MKIKILFINIVIIFITLMPSCSSGPVMTRATGLPYEIIVVMDRNHWNGEAGEAIKGELESAIPILPRPEPAFKITYVSPNDFNGLLTYVRSILIVRIDDSYYTQANIGTERNRWSNGQLVMTLNAPDAESVVEWVNNNPRRIVRMFTKEEMEKVVGQLEKTYSSAVMDNVKTKFDLSLKVPSDMTYIKNGDDFFWASNNANTGRTDVIVYTFPYRDNNTFTEEYLIEKRDSVLKKNVPGSFPNSYMSTERRAVEYSAMTLHGKYCGVLRGLWRMEGDMMGGPFVSHIRLDELNNRVVVVEGFVFAPETDKRNFIRRIEAALYTLRLPQDNIQSTAEIVVLPEDGI